MCHALEEHLRKILPNVGFHVIRGVTTPNERIEYLEEFKQHSNNTQILLLSLMACSTGLNLGFVETAIFAEMWPASSQMLQQAEMRLVRSNSTHRCAKQVYMVVENHLGIQTKERWLDLDSNIWPWLSAQLDRTTGVLDGKNAAARLKQIHQIEKSTR